MAKILIMGAGSAQANGVINCLMQVNHPEEVIAAGSEPTDLIFAPCKKRYLIPHSTKSNYQDTLLSLLAKEQPDLIHFQHDKELYIASGFRDEILNTGTRLFIPDHKTIETCVFKHQSYLKFQEAGIPVPRNMVIQTPTDLQSAFSELGDENGTIWLRSMGIGGGGLGSLPTNDPEFARVWINNNDGWGDFVAAEMLTPKSVTWLSIWHEGELVVGQGRIRHGWSHAARAVSGVTGITKVGRTFSDPAMTQIALDAIHAVSDVPHGIYGVDMTYDKQGVPNPTEINIGRFFTTVEFFKQAGLNMPVILKDIAIHGKFPVLKKKIDPLKEGLLWMRSMDKEPVLLAEAELQHQFLTV